MKLIIQIPCYNEEETLPLTLDSLPIKMEGFDCVEWLIIDDGSQDKTVEVAKQHGGDHLVCLPTNRGLAYAFMAGLEACLDQGADVIVNTDADNQYYSGDIDRLVRPIVQEQADIVIGKRPIYQIKHFSSLKKRLQKIGSNVVRIASRTDIPDAPSGFRAISRSAALRLNVFSEYTYTLETIIQAGQKGMQVTSIPIQVNEDLRPSRLVRSIWRYVWNSILTIIRIFTIYRPFKAFFLVGMLFFVSGLLIGSRFLFHYFFSDGSGHIQSLILAAILLNYGLFLVMSGVIADLISINRRLIEDIQWRQRRMWREKDSNKTSK